MSNPPRRASEIDDSEAFSPEELLFRRVKASELDSAGEIDASQLESVSFDKKIEGAPSVLRARYSSARDVLAPECADGKDVSMYLAYQIRVLDVPFHVTADDGVVFRFAPVHKPLTECGAHSVIGCFRPDDHLCSQYVKPSRSARNKLRVALAIFLKPSHLAIEEQS